jgi:hypothetical protein
VNSEEYDVSKRYVTAEEKHGSTPRPAALEAKQTRSTLRITDIFAKAVRDVSRGRSSTGPARPRQARSGAHVTLPTDACRSSAVHAETRRLRTVTAVVSLVEPCAMITVSAVTSAEHKRVRALALINTFTRGARHC